MSDPTIYFPLSPVTGIYDLGFNFGRQYNTVISTGPTMREQRRPRIASGLRFWNKLTINCRDPQTNLPDEDMFETLRGFERAIMGMYNPFWIYDPVPVDFPFVIPIEVTAGVATNLPYLLPWIGGVGVYFGSSSTDFDNNGPGYATDPSLGEWQLINYDASALPDGVHNLTLTVTGAFVRYAVRKTHDTDDWGLNFNAARPPKRVTISIRQDRG